MILFHVLVSLQAVLADIFLVQALSSSLCIGVLLTHVDLLSICYACSYFVLNTHLECFFLSAINHHQTYPSDPNHPSPPPPPSVPASFYLPLTSYSFHDKYLSVVKMCVYTSTSLSFCIHIYPPSSFVQRKIFTLSTLMHH